MKIKYKADDSGFCLDSCKYYPTIKIGSLACSFCPHNTGIDMENKTIECKRYE